MFRLYFKDKIAIQKEQNENCFEFYTHETISNMKENYQNNSNYWFNPNIEKQTSDFLENFNTITNYIDFIKELRYIEERKIAGIYMVSFSLAEGTFFIFKSNYLPTKRAVLLLKYKPENDIMLDFTLKLLRMDLQKCKLATKLVCDATNHFIFIARWQILKIIYTKIDLDHRQEEIFKKFTIPKKSGGVRVIYAPHEEIKSALRDLNFLLQNVYDKRNSTFQIAYKRGKCIKDGVVNHVNNKYVFNLDLKDFYPSCKKELVKKYTNFLFLMNYNRDLIEEIFYETILINDGLFIGSPISGTLANAILSPTMKYVFNICKQQNMGFSVYADDISFSSNKPIAKKYIEDLFLSAFKVYKIDQYFSLNNKKSVGFSGCRRKITGVSINNNNQISVSRKYYKDLRTKIAHLGNGDNVNIQQLRGKIAYALMIDDTGKIERYLKKFKSVVEEYKLISTEKMQKLNI